MREWTVSAMQFSPKSMPSAVQPWVAGRIGAGQRALLVGCALAVGSAAAPAWAADAPLLTFRSVHDLVLDPASPSEGVTAVTARLVTEFTGSQCKGYTDQTRFVMQTTDEDGMRQTSDLRQLTTEATSGK